MKKNTNKKAKSNSTNTRAIDEMDLYTLCRWASLKDAIDLIGEKCEEKRLDFDSFEIKPLDLLKYVDSMTDDMFHRVSQYQTQYK
jgi:hypothetical protein